MKNLKIILGILSLSDALYSLPLTNVSSLEAGTYKNTGENGLEYEDVISDGNPRKLERYVLIDGKKKLIALNTYTTNSDHYLVEKIKYKVTTSDLKVSLNDELKSGESWQTDRLKLVMQKDGNLVLYDLLDHPLWSSHTQGKSVSKVVLQEDGLCLYNKNNKLIWKTTLRNKSDKVEHLRLQTDGNLVLYSASNTPVFATNTNHQYANEIQKELNALDFSKVETRVKYDKNFNILVDEKNNKYSWNGNKISRIKDPRGYSKEYNYNKDEILESISYIDDKNKKRIIETFNNTKIKDQPVVVSRTIKFLDDNSEYTVDIKNNDESHTYKISEGDNKIASFDYKIDISNNLLKSTKVVDFKNSKDYLTTYEYNDDNHLNKISLPNDIEYSNIYDKEGKINNITLKTKDKLNKYNITYTNNNVKTISSNDGKTKINYFYDTANNLIGNKCVSSDKSFCPNIGEAGLLAEEFIVKDISDNIKIDIKKSYDNYYQFTTYKHDKSTGKLVSFKKTDLIKPRYSPLGKNKTKKIEYSLTDKFYDDQNRLIYDGKNKFIYDPMGSNINLNKEDGALVNTEFYKLNVNKNDLSISLSDQLTKLGIYSDKKVTQTYVLDLENNVMPIIEKKYWDGFKDTVGGMWNMVRDINPVAIYANILGYDSPLPAYGDQSYSERMKGYAYGIYSSSPVAFITGDYQFFSFKYGLLKQTQIVPVLGSLSQAGYNYYYNANAMSYYYLGSTTIDLAMLMLDPVLRVTFSKLKALKAGEVIKTSGDINLSPNTTVSGEFSWSDKGFDGAGEYYINNKRVYSGEFKKGQFNGNGKLMDNHNVYQGEFRNGELKKGKHYVINEKQKFEFEVMNKKITQEIPEKALVYDGEYKNGLKDGYGKQYDVNNKLVYEGDYSLDKHHGQGIKYNIENETFYMHGNNLTFKGEFNNGLPVKGELFEHGSEKLIYSGEVDKDYTPHGKGNIYFDNDYRYEGQFLSKDEMSNYISKDKLVKGKKPYGNYYYKDELLYSGEVDQKALLNNEFKPRGVGKFQVGENIIEGRFPDDGLSEVKVYNAERKLIYEGGMDSSHKYSGVGTLYINDDLIFKGVFRKNKSYRGKIFDADLKLIYEGEVNDRYQFHGNGQYYIGDGERFKGSFIDGKPKVGDLYKNNTKLYQGPVNSDYKPHGEGKLYMGDSFFKGYFKDGVTKKGKVFSMDGRLIYQGSVNDNFTYKSGIYHLYGGEIFKGEFKANSPYKGKLYNYSKTLYYDGEVNNIGQPHGKGVYFSENTKKFQGHFENGEPQYGKIFNSEKEIYYQGEVNYKFHPDGEGVFSLKKGFTFEGVFDDHVPIKGKFFDSSKFLHYDGEVNHMFQRDGKGTIYFKGGGSFEGFFNKDKPYVGKISDINKKLKYDGYVNDLYKADGEGTIYFGDENTLKADFENGEIKGKVKTNFNNEIKSQTYEGIVNKDLLPEGKGYQVELRKGEIYKYYGEFKEGKFDGKGILEKEYSYKGNTITIYKDGYFEQGIYKNGEVTIIDKNYTIKIDYENNSFQNSRFFKRYGKAKIYLEYEGGVILDEGIKFDGFGTYYFFDKEGSFKGTFEKGQPKYGKLYHYGEEKSFYEGPVDKDFKPTSNEKIYDLENGKSKKRSLSERPPSRDRSFLLDENNQKIIDEGKANKELKLAENESVHYLKNNRFFQGDISKKQIEGKIFSINEAAQDELIYKGEVNKMFEPHGKGKQFLFKRDDYFIGDFLNGNPVEGELKYFINASNDEIFTLYKGPVNKDFKPDGIGGTYHFRNSSNSFTGDFENGIPIKGVLYDINGKIIERKLIISKETPLFNQFDYLPFY